MRVVWEESVLHDIDAVMEYGLMAFGEKSVTRFWHDIQAYEPLLASFPYIGRQEPYLSHLPAFYRSLVVHKHYKLVYRVDDIRQTVYIVALWDTRRNPQQMDNDVTHK